MSCEEKKFLQQLSEYDMIDDHVRLVYL